MYGTGVRILKRSCKIAALTNLCLLGLLLIVGAVCFYPLGVSTAGQQAGRVCREGDRDSRYVSPMFCVFDGADYVPQILDTLDDFGVKATFFVSGSWADDHAATLREIESRGHELGNGGYFQTDPGKLSYEKSREEIRLCGELVQMLTGRSMSLYCPFDGGCSDEVADAAESLGYTVVLWSQDTKDLSDADRTMIFDRAAEARGGELIRMHPTAETAAALPSVLQFYLENDLEPVPVSVNIAGIAKG